MTLPKNETLGEQIDRYMENKRIGEELAGVWNDGLEEAATIVDDMREGFDPDRKAMYSAVFFKLAAAIRARKV